VTYSVRILCSFLFAACISLAHAQAFDYKHTINLAGKQRMLTQKMSKEYYLVAYGTNKDQNKANLSKTVDLFDKTLQALIHGDNELGLAKSPSDAITAQLNKVEGLWKTFRQHIEANISDENNMVIANTNIPLLKEMNKGVKLFETFNQ
tara:strand:+ start:102 stop:548 length:447 start_codon:yes stop_codon:yes gene_type:complete